MASRDVQQKGARMARKPATIANLRLRLPEALRKTLAIEAEKNNRSLNSEILFRLGRTLSAEWREFIGEIEKTEKAEQEFIEQLMQKPDFRETLAKLVREMPRKPNA